MESHRNTYTYTQEHSEDAKAAAPNALRRATEMQNSFSLKNTIERCRPLPTSTKKH